MIDRYFGNPADPFNEYPDGRPTLLALDAKRICAADQINYMALAADSVAYEDVGVGLVARTVGFSCHAPFDPNSGLCLNRSAPHYKDRINNSPPMTMAITLGDLRQSGTVTSRWIEMSRVDGEAFGVTGISRELPSDEYEMWQIITMHMRRRQSSLRAEVWGVNTDDDGHPRKARIDIPRVKDFDAYCVSLQLAIRASAEKLKQAE